MVERYDRRDFPNAHRVENSQTKRLCLRPRRLPGIAPDCEEARHEEDVAARLAAFSGGRSLAARRRVTLPELKCQETSR